MARARVGDVRRLEDGQMMTVKVGETDVLLVRHEGRYHALGAHCPHYHAPLADGLLHDGRVTCPWHQSVFAAASGDLCDPPALDGLPRFQVDVEGDDLYVTVPDDAADHEAPEHAARQSGADDRTFAILGAGAAGLAAAQELRRAGFAGRIVLVSHEKRLPYDRPNCSKDYLAGEAEEEWMPLRGDDFYAEWEIERWTRYVERVETASRRVTFVGGETLVADRLLLATGALPRRLDVPGAELGNVLTLRSWDDADRIIAAAANAEKAVVVGSSFIGTEVAASLKTRGVASVTIVSPDAEPFAKALGPDVGRFARRLLEEKGVSFHPRAEVTGFEGDGAVEAVLLGDAGRLDADLVVLGVGVRPATDAVVDLERADDGSLRTDRFLRVADGVYAAGDIATFPDPRTNEPIRSEHWRLAQQQGQVAARNMVEHGAAPFDRVPVFWTAQAGTPIGYVGFAPSWDRIVVDGDLEKGEFVACYVSDGHVLAAAGVGRDRDLAAIAELMRIEGLPSDAGLGDAPVDWQARLRAATT